MRESSRGIVVQSKLLAVESEKKLNVAEGMTASRNVTSPKHFVLPEVIDASGRK